MSFTLLDSDTVLGRTSPFDKLGSEAVPSDWAVLSGTDLSNNGNGDYWLRNRGTLAARVIAGAGNVRGLRGDTKKQAGIRPFLTPEEAKKVMASAKQVDANIYELGEYPQSVEDDDTIIDELEAHYGNLQETGMSFTANDPDEENGFSPVEYPVYEYAGAKYIRVEADLCANTAGPEGGKLSNKQKPVQGDVYWVRVEPIRWVAGEDGSLTSEKILVGGVPFGEDEFDKSYVKEFLDNHFEKEIYQSPEHPIEKGNLMDEIMDEVEQEMQEEQASKQEEKKVDTNAPKKKKPHVLKVSHKDLTIDEEIAGAVRKGDSVMLHGMPGVGKTKRVMDIDPDAVAIAIPDGVLPEEIRGRTVYSDVKLIEAMDRNTAAIKGLKEDKKEKEVLYEKDETTGKDIPVQVVKLSSGGEWYAPHWYNRLCELCKDGKQHILFIDELTNARETTQGLIFNLIQHRSIEVNLGKLPDNAVIVCAGNEPMDSNVAYNMPEPLFDRFVHVHIPLDMDAWLRWGSLEDNTPQKDNKGNIIEIDYERHNVHPLVASFVAAGGEARLFDPYIADPMERPEEQQKDPTLVHSLSPRKWKALSDRLYFDGEVTEKAARGYIGTEEAKKFIKWLDTNPVTLQEILDGNYKRVPTNPDEVTALMYSCRYVSEGEEVTKVREFFKKHYNNNDKGNKVNYKELMETFESIWVHSKDEMQKNIRKGMYKNISTLNGGR